MSIVVAFLEANCRVGIFADKKVVWSDSKGNIHRTDEIFKVYSISDTIAYGITGDPVWGIALAQELLNSATNRASELIELIKKHPKPKEEGSTFTLIGIYDNKLPFIFAYKTCGSSSISLNETAYSFATSPEQYLENCKEYFFNQKELGYDLEKCCVDTIKFASQQNPAFISETYDSFEILYK